MIVQTREDCGSGSQARPWEDRDDQKARYKVGRQDMYNTTINIVPGFLMPDNWIIQSWCFQLSYFKNGCLFWEALYQSKDALIQGQIFRNIPFLFICIFSPYLLFIFSLSFSRGILTVDVPWREQERIHKILLKCRNSSLNSSR